MKMEKAYWDDRYRLWGGSKNVCTNWNWDKEVCEREVDECRYEVESGECTRTFGFQRAWKWKAIREAIRKHSPELLKSKSLLHSPPEPRAPIIRGAQSKRAIQDPVMVTRSESENRLVLSKVIDVGCGDLVFWSSKSLRLAHTLSWHTHGIILTEEYIGIDISDTVIMRNRRMSVKGWSFIASSSHVLNRGLKAPVVFCIDLLFHIMDDMAFIDTLKNLCHYSEDLILIHTWMYKPFKNATSDGVYQKYRPLEAYFGIFTGLDFTLVEERPNPNGVGGLYVFKRKYGRL
jgi:hypothetical protein